MSGGPPSEILGFGLIHSLQVKKKRNARACWVTDSSSDACRKWIKYLFSKALLSPCAVTRGTRKATSPHGGSPVPPLQKGLCERRQENHPQYGFLCQQRDGERKENNNFRQADSVSLFPSTLPCDAVTFQEVPGHWEQCGVRGRARGFSLANLAGAQAGPVMLRKEGGLEGAYLSKRSFFPILFSCCCFSKGCSSESRDEQLELAA